MCHSVPKSNTVPIPVQNSMSNGHHICWPRKCSVLIEQLVKFDTNADIFLLNSVLLKEEQVIDFVRGPLVQEHKTYEYKL